MRVWVFVEGESDRLALEALWRNWKVRLGDKRCGLKVIAMNDKSRFLRKIGPRAGEKLENNSDDVVVGLPDLYPNDPYRNTRYGHADYAELAQVQSREVKEALRKVYNIGNRQLPQYLDRFYPSALKHDLEMLLLAAKDQLRRVLKTSEAIGGWSVPVEDQNQGKPPKRVVKNLFLTKSERKHAYRDTKDAPAVLRGVDDLSTLLFTETGRVNCPKFKEMLDWLGNKTNVAPYVVLKPTE